jgi:two-component system sensor histidine kinase UhpB
MASMAAARMSSSERSSRPLFWRVAFTNAAILSIGVSVLAVSPATKSFPVSVEEALVLAVGTLCVLAANMLALRRAFEPLVRLSTQMARVDPLEPGIRAVAGSGAHEIVALALAFNQMAERLETERRESALRAQRAQEAARRRVAQEIHDDIGQSLTFLLIQLAQARQSERPVAALDAAVDTARAVLEDARSISERLRPESLDDLGLVMALETLAARVQESASIYVTTDVERGLPELDADADVAIFRVAQEALTNAVRHSGATTAAVSLRRDGEHVVLRVADNGRGIDDAARRGGGMRGMRERALSIGASLEVRPTASGGTCVALDLGAR